MNYNYIYKMIRNHNVKKITCILLLTTGLIGFNNQSFAEEAPDFQQTKQLAEKGDAIAQYNFGSMYTDGIGVEKMFSRHLNGMKKLQNKVM